MTQNSFSHLGKIINGPTVVNIFLAVTSTISIVLTSSCPFAEEVSESNIRYENDLLAEMTAEFRQVEFKKYIVDHKKACGAAPESPIIISKKSERFSFTDSWDTVQFDMNADGVKENLGWTKKNSDLAFLAIDRNGNGKIDDGTELFSSLSPQQKSACKNGYVALKDFDTNKDGLVSSADRDFEKLLLWVDINHNGVSEVEELESIRNSLRTINIKPFRSDMIDHPGNYLSLFGTATTKNNEKIYMVDVRFLELIKATDVRPAEIK